jgi:hypothetical protein
MTGNTSMKPAVGSPTPGAVVGRETASLTVNHGVSTASSRSGAVATRFQKRATVVTASLLICVGG